MKKIRLERKEEVITKKKENFKLLGKLRTEENLLSLINDISEKPTANIILMVSD